MHRETGGSYSSRLVAGNGRVGLIQLSPRAGHWAAKKGYSAKSLTRMTRAEQMKVVDQYLYDNNLRGIEKPNIDDLYHSIWRPFSPRDAAHIHFETSSSGYRGNSSLDVDGDGDIDNADVSFKIRDEDVKGVGKYRSPTPQDVVPHSIRNAASPTDVLRAVTNEPLIDIGAVMERRRRKR